MINAKQIRTLYNRYLELIKLEVEMFGVKPTEVRHLIGRLGEFYCALKVDGTLAHSPNQQGFDVVCQNGKRISMKTTAQKTGFIAISSKTINIVDDLMIIQYLDQTLSITTAMLKQRWKLLAAMSMLANLNLILQRQENLYPSTVDLRQTLTRQRSHPLNRKA
ncbi:hypothetical protein DTO96_100575 [Ephemeroptericola cinctiostellae]|uniref:DUF6998 domain-containing protein n=1 Tax=Ephemeroptericola cinctiostellae TaxID=2268024 RepID=A0A345D926_9BURK|nr:hypothetical protein [Ephemeroptericola cinctiostellae]AXF84864.1 hypothetical protein DTO96_100575 [Ephemeroptericola cinctiostellae]